MMENEEKSPEFGRYLRTHRRSKGISLEEVSQKTKINLAILRQLESENLEGLPAPTFVKGFIRAYAQVVGVDEQEAVKRYVEKLSLERKEAAPENRPAASGRRPWRRFVLIGLVVALLLGAALYLML